MRTPVFDGHNLRHPRQSRSRRRADGGPAGNFRARKSPSTFTPALRKCSKPAPSLDRSRRGARRSHGSPATFRHLPPGTSSNHAWQVRIARPSHRNLSAAGHSSPKQTWDNSRRTGKNLLRGVPFCSVRITPCFIFDRLRRFLRFRVSIRIPRTQTCCGIFLVVGRTREQWQFPTKAGENSRVLFDEPSNHGRSTFRRIKNLPLGN